MTSFHAIQSTIALFQAVSTGETYTPVNAYTMVENPDIVSETVMIKLLLLKIARDVIQGIE